MFVGTEGRLTGYLSDQNNFHIKIWIWWIQMKFLLLLSLFLPRSPICSSSCVTMVGAQVAGLNQYYRMYRPRSMINFSSCLKQLRHCHGYEADSCINKGFTDTVCSKKFLLITLNFPSIENTRCLHNEATYFPVLFKITGRTRLIRSVSSTRFCFELSRNSI